MTSSGFPYKFLETVYYLNHHLGCKEKFCSGYKNVQNIAVPDYATRAEKQLQAQERQSSVPEYSGIQRHFSVHHQTLAEWFP